MRIAIDMQACQLAGPLTASGQYLFALVHAMRRLACDRHELVLVASSAWPETIDSLCAALGVQPADSASMRVFHVPSPVAARSRVNGWRRRAAELARESYMASLEPDAVLVLDLARGYDDDAVVSTGKLRRLPTVALLPGAMPPAAPGPQAYVQWRHHVVTAARQADHVFASRGLAQGDPGFDWDGGHTDTLPEDPADAATQILHALEALNARQARRPTSGGRPRLAYVSPLPPAASGIADYSAELLPALVAHYDIEVILAQPDAPDHVAGGLVVRTVPWFETHAARYDRILYHFGNSPFHGHMVSLLRRYPGTVVLHDFYLGHLFGYAQHSGLVPLALRGALFRSHGYRALGLHRQAGEGAALQAYPCSLDVFTQATGVVVHSQHARELAHQWYGEELPCTLSVVPLAHASPARPLDKAGARSRLGIANETFLVCSFGYVGAGKMSRELVQAWMLSLLSRNPRCQLVLVGGHQIEGEYSAALEDAIAADGGVSGVRIAGYVPADAYRDYLLAADMAVQLRANSRGETSRAVLDAMAHDVPLIVNAHGSVTELPDAVACKLDDACTVEQIAQALEQVYGGPEHRASMVHAAAAYVRGIHDPALVADRYRQAIETGAACAPDTATGHMRGVIKALADAVGPVQAPARADINCLVDCLMRNHPQPQARAARPQTEALRALLPAPAGARPLVRGLLLSVYPVREARNASEVRVAAMQAVYRGAGVALDTASCRAWRDSPWHGPAWWADLPISAAPLDAVSSPDPQAWRDGVTLLEQAASGPAVNALAQRIASAGYDFVQIEQPFLWPLLRSALEQMPQGRPWPCLVYSAHRIESDAAAALPDSPAVAGCERELARAATIVIAASDSDAARLACVAQSASKVHIFRNGAVMPRAAVERTTVIHQDHFAQAPFALIASADDVGARSGFEAMFAHSLAFLPPDTRLIVAGSLCAYLETSRHFNRWADINRARCRLVGEVDEQTLATLRRHAHVIVLPRTAHDAQSGPDVKTAEALSDGRYVLATSAALQGFESHAARPDVFVEDDPARFCARLTALLQKPARAGTPASIAPWHVMLAGVPAVVARAAAGLRARKSL